jgi:triphosphoribosyl-dephospho-CoA synthase
MQNLALQSYPADPAEHLAGLAVFALIEEARLSPKPGLVDSRGAGAHDDLDLALMRCSALALEPAFVRMARAAANQETSIGLREHIGAIGRDGETAMLQATGGVNTHRGAIWALGLLTAAAAMTPTDGDAARIAAQAGELARLPDRFMPETPRKGATVCKTYGIKGARGEAQAGFPHVLNIALPALHAARQRGESETAARLNSLIAMMTSLVDTCVLSRGGMPALLSMQRGAQTVLDAGGVATLPGRRALLTLDRQMLSMRASPGGAADLLAATLFLDQLAQARAD